MPLASSNNTTHLLSGGPRETVGTDSTGEPIYSYDGISFSLEDVPVHLSPAGPGYVRGDTGEYVRSTPKVRGSGKLLRLSEGDVVTLRPTHDGPGDPASGDEWYRVLTVSASYSMRGTRRATVELERISD